MLQGVLGCVSVGIFFFAACQVLPPMKPFIAKVWHKTQPYEMCVQSHFEQVFTLYGDLEKDRGQSHSTQSYNGLLGSYLQERSAAINWPVKSSRAVHIPFHRPVETIFHHPKGSQKGRL